MYHLTLTILALGLAACGGRGAAQIEVGASDRSADDDASAAGGDDTSAAGGDDTSAAGSDDTSGGEDTAPTNPACAEPSAATSLALTQLTVDGVVREYRLSVPETAAGVELPVLMAFHGGDGREAPFPQQDQFESLATEREAIMVYPLSELLPINEGEWQLNTSDEYRQDIDFVEAILDDLSSRYCVDAGRVYATGYSLGSMFTYELPCHVSERFAAIASFAGTMPVEPYACEPEDPVAVLHIHGEKDVIIAYDKEWDWKEWDYVGTMMDIPGLVAFWSERYSCQETQETSGADVYHLAHDACDGGARVEHYRLANVGHEWPNTIDGAPTAEVIWGFVEGFSKP